MPKRYHIFMPLKATTTWLALKPEGRFGFLRTTLEPIFAAHPAVKLRFFDSEFFAGHVSDIALWETDDLSQWQSLVEQLRETMFWDQYFEVKDILLSVENAYADHYAERPAASA